MYSTKLDKKWVIIQRRVLQRGGVSSEQFSSGPQIIPLEEKLSTPTSSDWRPGPVSSLMFIVADSTWTVWSTSQAYLLNSCERLVGFKNKNCQLHPEVNTLARWWLVPCGWVCRPVRRWLYGTLCPIQRLSLTQTPQQPLGQLPARGVEQHYTQLHSCWNSYVGNWAKGCWGI